MRRRDTAVWLTIKASSGGYPLCSILLRFRSYTFALSADIEKAFLHVKLNEVDKDYTRFLWLSDANNPGSALTTYRFNVVPFGTASSLSQAVALGTETVSAPPPTHPYPILSMPALCSCSTCTHAYDTQLDTTFFFFPWHLEARLCCWGSC